MLYEQQMREIFKFMPSGINVGWIAGGAVTSVFTNAKINDFDLYFSSRGQFEEALDQAYAKNFWCVAITSRAITFKKEDALVQLMHFKWFDSPDAIFSSFDYTACMGAVNLADKSFHLHPSFLVDASRRELCFNAGTDFPIASGVRLIKYRDRGFTISRKDTIKLLITCSFKKIETWDQLKEQIGGAYGQVVAIATDQPFNLENAIKALDGAHFESKTEAEPPYSADAAIEALKSMPIDPRREEMPSNAEDAMKMIDKLKGGE